MSKLKILFRIMKFTLPFFILSLGPWISGGYAQEVSTFLNSTSVISMDFKDADLKDVLKAFSIQSGINFIASQEIEERKVTLYLDKVSVKEAIDKLLKANKLDYDFAEKAKIILVKKAEPEIKTITKIFHLKHHSVPNSNIKKEVGTELGGGGEEEGGDILTSIKDILSRDGKVTEDTRTNSLIITDVPSRLFMIEEVLAQLDVPVPQAMFEVEILDVSKNLIDNLGFNFTENPLTLILPGGFAHRGARFFMGDLTKRGIGIDAEDDEGNLLARGSIILGNTYAGLLDFLRTQTDTKILARPRILTLNNETAEIKIETDEVVGREREESTDTGIVTYEAERAKTGISLRVTPQINVEIGEITMFILPTVKQAFDSTILDEDSQPYKNIEERGTKSVVRVRDGDTVIIGGLIRKEFSQTTSKLPILGDIPILGALFRNRTKDKDLERELLVFITPHIIGEVSPSLAKVSSAILSSREQDIP